MRSCWLQHRLELPSGQASGLRLGWERSVKCGPFFQIPELEMELLNYCSFSPVNEMPDQWKIPGTDGNGIGYAGPRPTDDDILGNPLLATRWR